MKIIECEQGSPEWHAARCGRVTASRVADIVRKGKSGPSKMRQTYMGELVAERLAGVQPSDGYVSGPMQHGKDNEDAAREMYGFAHGVTPVKVGFVVHPAISMAGASPDSLIGSEGGIEIKCPNSSQHIATLLGQRIDPDYIVQKQWNMACTGAKWWDFVSYDPRLPAEMQLHVQRVHRDPQMISDLEMAVVLFLEEVAATVEQLTAKFMREAA